MQAIIFPNRTTISVIRPLDCGLTIQEIARKDVPFGVPYRIIDAAAIPTDRTYRSAWNADFSAPNGRGLGPHRWWIEKSLAEIAQLQAQNAPADAETAKIFEAERAAKIKRLQARITQMKAEVFELEGVRL